MPESHPLAIDGLGHAYGSNRALSGVDLVVKSGEFVSLLGPSGCGKTTLLRSVAGLVNPAEGSISIDGRIVNASGSIAVEASERGIGLVFQEYALFPHMTVAENIGYGLRNANAERVSGLMAVTDLTGLANRKPSELSGGQQQRAALARALAPRPALLLLDEPFANVDAGLRASLGRVLTRLVRDEGVSVLMVTHDQDSALAMSDRIVVLGVGERGGLVTQDGSPEDIYVRPATAEVARLGGPALLLAAQASDDTATSALGPLALHAPRRGPVTVVIRPEQAHFLVDPTGNAAVESMQFHRTHHRLRCTSPAGEVDVVVASNEPLPAIGDRGFVRVREPVWALEGA